MVFEMSVVQLLILTAELGQGGCELVCEQAFLVAQNLN